MTEDTDEYFSNYSYRMKISVIIPLHNEELNIPTLLLSLTNTLNIFYRDRYELVLVNDNSNDNTSDLIESYKSVYPQIKTVHRTITPGFGNAIKSGLSISTGEIFVLFMGDLSDDPETIPRMVNAIDQGYDIAYGSRFTKYGKTINYPIPKLISNRVFNNSIKYLFGIPHSDYTNAFKAYRREVIDTIGIDNLESSAFDLTVELPLKAHILGFTSVEVPTTWTNRVNGEANLKLSENASKYGLRLLQSFFSGLYLSLKDMSKIVTGSKTKILLASIISILLIVGMFKLIPGTDILVALQSLYLPYIFLVFIMCITVLLIRSYRWQLLLKISGQNAPFGIVYKNNVFGFFLNYMVPARAGDFAKTLTLKATTGIPASISLTTILVERIIDMSTIMLLLIMSLIMIPTTPVTNIILLTSITITVILIAGLYGMYIFNGSLSGIFPKYKPFFDNTKTTTGSMITPSLAVPILISIPLWIIEFSTIYFVAKSIGIDIPYFVTTTGGVVAALAQTVPITIGSIGVYEATLTTFLVLFGVKASPALTISIIDHSIRIVILLILGIIATIHIAFLSRNYFRKNKT